MVQLKVEYNGEKKTINVDPVEYGARWGSPVFMILMGMGRAFVGSSMWSPGASTQYDFSSEGDNGVWEALVKIQSSGAIRVKVSDMGFMQQ